MILGWLHDFERRLQYAAPPVREWLQDSMERYPALRFIAETLQLLQTHDLETAWGKALDPADGLAEEDVTALRTLGTHLGKSDADTQLQCVRETLAALEESRTAAMTAAEKADKLYLTLGTSGGLALALLLV